MTQSLSELIKTPISSTVHCNRCKSELREHESWICDACDAETTGAPHKPTVKPLFDMSWPARHKDGLDHFYGPALSTAKNLWDSHVSKSATTLVLYGERGRGKTGMATWWAAQRTLAGQKSGMYATAYELFLTIRRAWHPSSKETESEAMRPYKVTPYLVIDQMHQCRALGTGDDKSTLWERMALAEVLDYRYRENLTTILIATLKTESELFAAIDPDIMDRVKESGGIVKCDWESYRL